jgi:hypothetical protein
MYGPIACEFAFRLIAWLNEQTSALAWEFHLDGLHG